MDSHSTLQILSADLDFLAYPDSPVPRQTLVHADSLDSLGDFLDNAFEDDFSLSYILDSTTCEEDVSTSETSHQNAVGLAVSFASQAPQPNFDRAVLPMETNRGESNGIPEDRTPSLDRESVESSHDDGVRSVHSTTGDQLKLRKYRCGVCHRAFKRNNHLKAHIQAVHLKSVQYHCSYCGKSYSSNSSHRKHIRLSHGTTLYNP